MPKITKKRVRSSCWYFYSKTDNGGMCRLCRKEVRSTGNTTNLLNHLKRKHEAQYTSCLENPENYEACSFMEDDNHQEHEGSPERKHDRDGDSFTEEHEVEETNQSHSLEAFQEQGGTVIWLQPSGEGQPSSFQPQITIVQHSVPEITEENQSIEGGETILGTGEIVCNPPANNDASSAPEEQKKPIDSHRKVSVQHSTGKLVPKSFTRHAVRTYNSPNLVKTVKSSPRNGTVETTNHVNREDTFDTFGKYVASLLRNLSSRKAACRLQKEMIWLVLQEQMRMEDS